jgi:hypothetical protein
LIRIDGPRPALVASRHRKIGTRHVPAFGTRKAEVDRIRVSVHEIANSGLTLSKLSVAVSLLGDLVKQ